MSVQYHPRFGGDTFSLCKPRSLNILKCVVQVLIYMLLAICNLYQFVQIIYYKCISHNMYIYIWRSLSVFYPWFDHSCELAMFGSKQMTAARRGWGSRAQSDLSADLGVLSRFVNTWLNNMKGKAMKGVGVKIFHDNSVLNGSCFESPKFHGQSMTFDSSLVEDEIQKM